jgi:sugar/nucleoside kinase (ribokinase family)
MDKFDLLTIGDVSIDQYMEIEDARIVETNGKKSLVVEYGGKLPVEVYRASIAGNSCNVAITANKLGMKCAVYTKIGDDPNGEKFVQTFRKVGIDDSLCIVDGENPTNVHTIISFEGERTILSHHPKRDYSIEVLENWFNDNGYPDWLYYTSMPPNFVKFQTQLERLIEQSEGKMGICFNPGSAHLHSKLSAVHSFLKYTDIVFLNKEEAELISGTTPEDVEELHEAILKLGPKISVITDSINGSSASDGTKVEKMGIFLHDMSIVDKTGAGDSFAGSFLAAIHYKKTLKEALRWGAINSAHVITRIGSIHGQLTLEELQETEKIVRSHAHKSFAQSKL